MKPGPDSIRSRFPYRFRPPWWGVLLAAIGCTVAIALGNWQLRRADEKRAAGAAVTQIALRGEFLPKHTVLLDNKVYRGRPGYHVVQPLRIAGGNAGNKRHVLVNRGWAAAGPRREDLPEIRTPAGEVALQGVRLVRMPRAYEPAGTKHAGRVWQNVAIDEFSAWSGLELEPYAIEQHSPLADGLVRDWPPRDLGLEVHQSYALQWYSLAALSVILLLVLNFKRDGHASG